MRDAERLMMEQFTLIQFEPKKEVNIPVEKHFDVLCQTTIESNENTINQYDDREKQVHVPIF